MTHPSEPHHVVYRLWVGGVVRYVGQGDPWRPKQHLREAKARLAGRGHKDQKKLYDFLCVAIAAGLEYRVEVLLTKLTEAEAIEAEDREVRRWPEDQLCNETGIERTDRLARQIAYLHSDLEVKSKHKQSMRSSIRVQDHLARLNADPEVKDKLRQSMQPQYDQMRGNPEHGARVSAGMRAAAARRQT